MLLVDHTSFSRKEAQAVKMLLSVYADHFAGEGFAIVKNPTSGNIFMSFDNIAVCPFVTSDGCLYYEVLNFETGEIFESDSLEEAVEYFANIYAE